MNANDPQTHQQIEIGTCKRPLTIDGAGVTRGACGGSLCVSGKEVRCESCGAVQENHPLTATWQGAVAPPREFVIEPQVFVPANVQERVTVLELELVSLRRECQGLRQALAELKPMFETLVAEVQARPKRQKAGAA